jgi:uncharacterized membrane protein
MSQPLEQQPPVVAPGTVRLEPMWLGAMALVMFAVGVIISLTYAFLGVTWQQSFGNWNMWTGIGLMIATVVPLRLWNTSVHKA